MPSARPEDAMTTTAPAVTASRPAVRLVEARRATARRRSLPRGVRRLGGPLLLLLLWQTLSSTGVVGPRTLAPPTDVLAAAVELTRSGELPQHLLASLRRVAAGLAIGVTAGLALATVAGLFRLGEDLVDSSMQILRAFPSLGLVSLMILWFGIGEAPKVALVAIGTTFPVYLNTYAAIRGVDAGLVEAGTTFGLDRRGLVRHVILPGAVPGFLVGLRWSLTSAWLIMVIAEQINATSGIGFLMNEARGWYRTDIIVLGLAVYGCLGLLADALVRLLERRLLSWRRGFAGR